MGWLPARRHAPDTDPPRFGWHTSDRRRRRDRGACRVCRGCREGRDAGLRVCRPASPRRCAVPDRWGRPRAPDGGAWMHTDELIATDPPTRRIAGAEQVEPSCLATGKWLAGLRSWTTRGCFRCARHGQDRGPGNAVGRRSAVLSAVFELGAICWGRRSGRGPQVASSRVAEAATVRCPGSPSCPRSTTRLVGCCGCAACPVPSRGCGGALPRIESSFRGAPIVVTQQSRPSPPKRTLPGGRRMAGVGG